MISYACLLAITPQQYERVFETAFDQMGKDGTDSPGMFEVIDHRHSGGHVPPDRLRRLFLRLLETDPLRRPTAQEAFEELKEIRDA